MNNAEIKNDVQKDIPLIYPKAPSGEEERVAGVLGAVESHIGFIPDGLRLFSFSPPLLETVAANISYFNGGTGLSPVLMTMIRYLSSWQTQCSYCIDLNEGFLTNMGLELDVIRAARSNPEAAPIAENEIPLLLLALKSVNTPEEVSEQDIKEVRASGWSDRNIFDVVVQAANNRAFSLVLRAFNVEHQGAFS